MFGRKAKRIKELETELEDVKNNLLALRVQLPDSVWAHLGAIRKDNWHHLSVRLKVSADGAHVDFKDVMLFNASECVDFKRYFDGS